MAKKEKKPPEQNVAETERSAAEQAASEETKQPVVQETDAGIPESLTFSAKEFDAVKAHIEALQKEKDENKARVEELTRQKTEMLTLAQRTQADFDNFRRRNASVRADSLEEGKRETIAQLLPVLDNFDRAMEAEAGEGDAWRDGIKLVYQQMLGALQKLGLTEVPTEGAFDPEMHNAVMQEKVEGKASGEILQVLQKGYRVGDRIVRHAMVKVAE